MIAYVVIVSFAPGVTFGYSLARRETARRREPIRVIGKDL